MNAEAAERGDQGAEVPSNKHSAKWYFFEKDKNVYSNGTFSLQHSVQK